MSVQLAFKGGLFVVHPGTPPETGDLPRTKVDVHMRMPERIEVAGPNSGDLERLLNSAIRIDFKTHAGFAPGAFDPSTCPLRRLACAIPVDFSGFHKVVSFNGGELKESIHSITEEDYQVVAQSVQHHGLYPEVTEALAADVNKGRRHLWSQRYEVIVDLGEEAEVVPNGWSHQQTHLSDNFIIRFPIADNSTIPHFPLNNPHVLEQPPTI